jgi:hypothetical protein
MISTRTLMTDDEIEARARDDEVKYGHREFPEGERIHLEVAYEPEYVALGLLRAELGVTAGTERFFSALALDVKVSDESGRVVSHQRPSLESIREESSSRNEDFQPEFGAAPDYRAIVPLVFDSNCLPASRAYRLDVRLFRPWSKFESASATFRVRAPTDAERSERERFGLDPYPKDLDKYVWEGDLRSGLASPLDATDPADPWRMLKLLAHAYGDSVEVTHTQVERLGTGAFRFSAENLARALDPNDGPGHIIYLQERAARKKHGPYARRD